MKLLNLSSYRYDSEAKSKRVELRNEGKYEFCYVICPATSEESEIDALDARSFACFAYSLPASIRQAVLGENYLQRLSESTGMITAAATGKASAKGSAPKGKDSAPPVLPVLPWNQLVVDPDNLPNTELPVDPLVVGAFTILPRIAVVQPGQACEVDISFDPSGCSVAREKVRVFIAGADFDDIASQTIHAFDLSGESCAPAISDKDIMSIFEEQEVVSSMDDTTGGKLERLPVGKVVFAERENILAWGPVLCNSGLGGLGRGVTERIRIINPTKIDVKVKVAIASSGTSSASAPATASKAPAKASAKASAASVQPTEVVSPVLSYFSVQPNTLDIPPHESRFINIWFNPTEITSYRAVFKAQVDEGSTQVCLLS